MFPGITHIPGMAFFTLLPPLPPPASLAPTVSGVDWMEDPLFQNSEENMQVNETITVEKLVVVKKSGGKLTE